MSKIKSISLVVLAIFASVQGSSAAPLINVAPTGTAIAGYTSSTSVTGTIYSHQGDASIAAANDNNLSTYFDTYGGLTHLDFFGVTFGSKLTTGVLSVTAYMRDYGDGGWFGQEGVGGPTLNSGNLIAPTLQITTDGTNWVDVATTDNYVTNLTGSSAGQGSLPSFTFTLDSWTFGIEGIRLVGQPGGVSGDGASPGFLGINEFQVVAEAPEPSTYAMMLAGVVFLGFCARRRVAQAK
jgi:hypothetical protein